MSSSSSRHGSPLRGVDTIPLPAKGEPPRVSRFAPSPTGYLHIGHAYSALFAYETARQCGGRFVLRIEDIDAQRCRPEFEKSIYDDLNWLGLHWDGTPKRQSDDLEIYFNAIGRLRKLDVLYPCFCSRKQIRAEIADATRAPHGPSGEMLYPGICRHLSQTERQYRVDKGESFAWRLDISKALAITGPLEWYDCRAGWIKAAPGLLGDVVLARKDTAGSYHLSVTIDDHLAGVTMITRGEDLFHATHVQRLLQALLGFSTPQYYHHNLIADSRGERLAKRNRAVTLRHLRDCGRQPADVWRLLGLGSGLSD